MVEKMKKLSILLIVVLYTVWLPLYAQEKSDGKTTAAEEAAAELLLEETATVPADLAEDDVSAKPAADGQLQRSEGAAVSTMRRGQTIVDQAGVLSAEDVQVLTAELDAFSRSTQMDSVVVLVGNTGGKTAEAYADDYFDYNGYGFGDEHEGVLLLIVTGDGSKGSRHIHISTSGSKTIEKITDAHIGELLDAAIDGGLRDNDYRRGILSYTEMLSELYTRRLSSLELLVALLAGLGVFIGMYLLTANMYRLRELPPYYDMKENTEAVFQSADDILLSSHTSRIKRPKEKAGGSSSSTHVSSSGRSHGGGGRSY